ncbi:MAG: hypothetical protein MI743_13625 [Sneathiellales bacterium]|nr:hypothetical protein [Sneathiellales bacterium]
MKSPYAKGRTAGNWSSLLKLSCLFTVCLAVLVLSAPVQAKGNDKLRLIMKDKKVIVYQLKEWAKCADTVKFLTIASDPAIYKGDRVHLQKIAGGVRAVTSLTCRRMKSMSIVGFVGKKVAYTGIASAAGGWRLKTVQLKKKTKPSSGGSKPVAKANPRPSSKSAPAPISPSQDKNFFAALAQAEEPDGTSGPGAPDTGNSRKSDGGDQVAALPPDDISDQQRRDGIAYRKLSGDLSQLMDMSDKEMLKTCTRISRITKKPGDADLLALRVCRALAYSAGQYDLADRIEGRLKR